MNNPIDIPALKAAAKKCIRPTEDSIDIVEMSRRYQRFRVLTQPTTVLTLIERLETAEHRLMSLGYRRSCGIPACNCGDQWAHKLLRDELRADRARLEKLASLLREWRAAVFFDTRERWLSWVEEFGPRVDAALAALEDSP